MNNTDELNDRFAIDGLAKFEVGEGGLTRLSITTGKADATLYTHGAHVSHFRPGASEPILWMSAASRYESGKAIRGGVPIVFPWFGPRQDDPKAPSHGLVRTTEWSIETMERLATNDIRISLATAVDKFSVVYRVTVGDSLGLDMRVTNESGEAVTFEQAFHTYLSVGDVRKIAVRGLEGATKIDKLDQHARKVQSDSPITFASETDSVYVDTESTVQVEDPLLGRTIEVQKQGSRSTVVWNPWIDKSSRMADFGDDEWTNMVCIESGNIADNCVKLAPGQSATMSTEIRVS
ncbi:MAG: D-hexose-6-phosphate mutarotase [Planctomycetota bacterium]